MVHLSTCGWLVAFGFVLQGCCNGTGTDGHKRDAADTRQSQALTQHAVNNQHTAGAGKSSAADPQQDRSIADQRKLTKHLAANQNIFKHLMQGQRAKKFAAWTGHMPIHAVLMMDGKLLYDRPDAYLAWKQPAPSTNSTCDVRNIGIWQLCRLYPSACVVPWELLEPGHYPQQPESPGVRPAKIAIHMVSTAAAAAAAEAAETTAQQGGHKAAKGAGDRDGAKSQRPTGRCTQAGGEKGAAQCDRPEDDQSELTGHGRPIAAPKVCSEDGVSI